MSLAAGSITAASMKYKAGDIVLAKSSAGDAIPQFHIKLIERIERKPPKDPKYVIWRAHLTKRKEVDKLRKEWQIPFKFPNETETFVCETNIIKLIKSDGKKELSTGH